MVNYGGNMENGEAGVPTRITKHTWHPAILDFPHGWCFLFCLQKVVEQNRIEIDLTVLIVVWILIKEKQISLKSVSFHFLARRDFLFSISTSKFFNNIDSANLTFLK